MAPREYVPPTIYGPTPTDPDELERSANELVAEIQKAVSEQQRPNNRKPKLSPGSRWDRDMVMQSIAPNHPDRLAVEPAERLLMVFIDDDPEDSGPNAIANTADALAAIRAAKLDPVFDSAVALAEYWDGLGHAPRANLLASHPELYELLNANSAAVKGSTSDG